MKYITNDTAADIRRAMTMAVVHTWFEFFPNTEHVDHEKARELVSEAFDKWVFIEDITVLDVSEPEYPEIHIYFDDAE